MPGLSKVPVPSDSEDVEAQLGEALARSLSLSAAPATPASRATTWGRAACAASKSGALGRPPPGADGAAALCCAAASDSSGEAWEHVELDEAAPAAGAAS